MDRAAAHRDAIDDVLDRASMSPCSRCAVGAWTLTCVADTIPAGVTAVLSGAATAAAEVSAAEEELSLLWCLERLITSFCRICAFPFSAAAVADTFSSCTAPFAAFPTAGVGAAGTLPSSFFFFFAVRQPRQDMDTAAARARSHTVYCSFMRKSF